MITSCGSIVLRDDDLGGGSGRALHRFELVSPALGFAEIDRGEELGAFLLGPVAGIASLLEQAFRQALLRPRRYALVGIGRHAGLHLHELLGVVGRPHDALYSMAAHAVEQGVLLLRRARHAL